MFQLHHQATANTPAHDEKRLCTEGPYLDYVTKIDALYPGTASPDPLNHHIGSRVGQSRSVVLERTPDHRWSRVIFNNHMEIKDHFSERQKIDKSEPAVVPRQRIYILDGLDPQYVEAFGSYFFMDPKFFVRQERNDLWNLKMGGSVIQNALVLPSLVNPERYFCVKYREVREFGHQLRDWRTVCALTGRHLAAIGFEGRLDTTAAVARKFSFWSRKDENDSWDVIILCDPPVHKLHIMSRAMTSAAFHGEPFQGGYPDFVKREDGRQSQTQTLEPPPRTSFLDDLCFYYEHYSEVLAHSCGSQATITPKLATIFPLKIVCSHYLKVIDYFEMIINRLAKVEWKLSRRSDYADYDDHEGANVQEQWSSLQLSARRLAEFSDDVEDILRDLAIPITPPDTPSHSHWTSSDEDLRYIYQRLQKMKNKVDQLTSATMGLSNIVGSRQALSEARRSVKEAKSTKTLTVVGLVFIPLAYTCALFSMSDDFRPGSHLFWVYFAVSVPLIFLVFVGTFVIQLGYDENVAWSAKRFKGALLDVGGKRT
ncbi:hypothetical protein BKA64DRAFT_380453 [Cadophora sp. MPI-SDFR-AT-0126]|nr:hypothetical protein BKA64DRAFT_380453 [Leotiomycetes sp. MPI-SDFR-AT-0126]